MNRQAEFKLDTGTAWLLRFIAVLWVIWGLVHVLAGVMTITQRYT